MSAVASEVVTAGTDRYKKVCRMWGTVGQPVKFREDRRVDRPDDDENKRATYGLP